MKTYLGVTGWSADGYFKGQIDELIFTNEVLTADDVEAYYLEGVEASGSQYKEITVVSPDDGAEVEVDYGTSLADVKRELQKIPYMAAAEGEEEPMELPTASGMWTVKDYTISSEGNIEATVKLEAPEGYMFNIDGRLSVILERKATVKVKEPAVISAVTPSQTTVTVPYGTSEDAVKDELAKLSFAVTTSDSNAYEIDNVKSKWTLAEAENGYKASYDLGTPEIGYKYAEGLKVEVQVTVAEAVKITSLTVTPATLEVDFGTPEEAVKEELAKLSVNAAVAAGSEAPAIKNTQDLWTIADYAAETAGNYTAKATIAAPVGYAFGDGVSNEVSVAVTVKAAGEHKLSRIVVSTPPARTKYIVGDDFDKTGIAVTAYYGDGQHADVTAKAVVEEATNLTLDKTSITITYTEGEGNDAIEKTCTQAITVNKVEDGAAVHYGFDGDLSDSVDSSKVAKVVKDQQLTDSTEQPNYQDGIKGQGILFNDGSQRTGVELAEGIPSAQKNFTINMWVNLKSEPASWGEVLMGTKQQWNKQFVMYAKPGGESGALEAQTADDGAKQQRFSGALIKDRWRMITFVNNESGAQFYVDGQAQTVDKDIAVKDGIQRIILGAGWWADYFHGSIDEVSIYDSSLKAEQVKALYDTITPTISGISVEANQDDFTFLKSDLNGNTDKIQTALKALAINVTVKSGEAPEIKNDADWTLTASETGYTATKEVEVPEGYALAKGVSKTLTVNVIVKDATLQSIAVIQAPNKINYKVGETFDKTGMKVKATYTDNSTKEVTADAITVGGDGVATKPDGATEDTWKQQVTVSYTDGGVTQSTTQEITVINPETPMGAVLAARTAYYTFDDTLDDSVKANTAAKSVANGSLAETNITDRYDSSGVKGSCLKVNQSTGGVLIPDVIAADAGEFTINLWVKKTSEATQFGTIMQGFNTGSLYGKGLVFYANTPNDQTKMQLEGNGGSAKQFTHNNDVWTMMTFVNKADTTEFYIDGQKQEMTEEEAKKYLVTTGISRITLGAGQWNANEYLVGGIDEVSLYNAALTAEQIALLKQEVQATPAE